MNDGTASRLMMDDDIALGCKFGPDADGVGVADVVGLLPAVT